TELSARPAMITVDTTKIKEPDPQQKPLAENLRAGKIMLFYCCKEDYERANSIATGLRKIGTPELEQSPSTDATLGVFYYNTDDETLALEISKVIAQVTETAVT